jgi:protein O-GlcNAc transferase
MKLSTFAAVVVLAGLAGCAGHGDYTKDGLRNATNKMAGLKAGNEYQQAEQAFMAGDLDKGMKFIDRSLAINPTVAKSHVLRGRIQIEKNDLEAALQSLQRAEALDPKNVYAQYYQGIVYERFSQSADALAHYQKAGELDPANPQYAVAAAESMIDLGRTEEAEAFLSQQKPAFEHNAGVRQTLGHIAMLRGDNEKAVKLFGEAHLLAPDDSVVTEDLIRAQMATAQFGEAIFNIERVLKSPAGKDRRDMRQLQARCLISLDRPVEAREILIQLSNAPEGQRDVETWIELGNIAYVLKDQGRLRLAAQRATSLAPTRPEGFTLKALWYRRQGELAAALENLDKAVQRRGKETDPLMLRGLVLQELGRTTEAKAAFAAVLEQEPSNEAAKTAYTSLTYAAAPESGADNH